MDIRDISDDLLHKAANRDMSAFGEVYKITSGFVHNVAFRIVGNSEDAQEVTQEVFLRLFDNLKSYKFQSSFKTWIYRVTVNTSLNFRRKVLKDLNHQTEYHENLHRGEDSGNDPAENEELVNNLLAAINAKQRVCVVLREIEGLSYAEIAHVLKINMNTVRSRLKRARERLLRRGVNNELPKN